MCISCTGDEGRSFGVGCSGAGFKPLQAAAVKSRGGERWSQSVGEYPEQVWVREAKFLNLCRRVVNHRFVVKTRGVSISWDKLVGHLIDWAGGDRRIGGATLIQASMRNCGNPSLRCEGRSQSGRNHKARVPRRSTGTDQPVRAMKAGNAARAKGLGQAVVSTVQLETGGN